MTISAGFSSLRAKYPYRAVLCATDVSVCRWNFPAANVTGKDRKSTRLNSSHLGTSYAVFCLKKNSAKVNDLRGSHVARATSARAEDLLSLGVAQWLVDDPARGLRPDPSVRGRRLL